MSRKSTREYTREMRERYAEADRGERMALLKEHRTNMGFSRSYADRLLTGKREYRDSPARGKVYDGETAVVLERVWRESGCMNTKYLAASMRDRVEDFETHVAVIPPGVRGKLPRMSASSMDRLL